MAADPQFLELLARVHRGDPDAREALVRPHIPKLLDAASHRAGDMVRARFETLDILQSTMAAFWKDMNGKEFENERALSAYLEEILEHKICEKADYLAAQKRDPRREVGGDSALDGIPGDCRTPSECAALRETKELLRSYVERLPALTREVMLLYLEGRGPLEIAARMGRRENEVRAQLASGRRRLRRMMRGVDL